MRANINSNLCHAERVRRNAIQIEVHVDASDICLYVGRCIWNFLVTEESNNSSNCCFIVFYYLQEGVLCGKLVRLIVYWQTWYNSFVYSHNKASGWFLCLLCRTWLRTCFLFARRCHRRHRNHIWKVCICSMCSKINILF